MSTTPTGGPQTPGAMPPAKKSNALLWVLGGCGTLIVIVILCFVGLYYYGMHKLEKAGISREQMQKNPALSAAKLAVTVNPDTEIVSSDDNAGTMVVRDKKTGKTTKMKFDPQKRTMVITDEKGKETTFSADSEKGNLEIKSDDGTMKIGANADKPPDWVPVYPGSSPKNTYSLSDAKEQNGSYVFTTSDASDKVMNYYDQQLRSGGLEVSSTTHISEGKVSGMVNGESKDKKRTVIVTVGAEGDGTSVSVVFTSKK
ncbi:MAG: hypothetical protein LAO20_16555 [Acidobacteriia bacterium]|nr:hypothetical protein [Terriglobia bacterium]